MTTASPIVTSIRTNIPMPEIKRAGGRGTRSVYPFDKLNAVGQSFGVKDKAAKQLASIVSNQNKRNAIVVKDEAGNPVKRVVEIDDGNGGKRKQEVDAFETKPGKTFKAFDVDPATDPDGASVRVFRTA